MDERLPHVVILGGGFGGLHAARSLRRAPVRVTLVDRRNFHLFQPLLYQVATGGLSPANIAAPLRCILKRQGNTSVLLGEVAGVDVARRVVQLTDGEISYDTLIVATGASHNYFGNPRWARFAPGLKTVEDATEIRARIFLAFEAAERESDPERIRAWLTFVVVGAGPTGVELAGALGEIAHDTLRREFKGIDPSQARILLIEAGPRPLPSYPPKLAANAASELARLGVTLVTGSAVTAVDGHGVTLRCGERSERVEARTVLWAAGVQASPLGKKLAEQTGAELDRAGRVVVGPDLTLPGHPEIFVIGDLAHFRSPDGAGPLPAVAQVAMQQGRHAARQITTRLARGAAAGAAGPAFRYRDYGTMSTIGRAAAVADLRGLHLSGYPAWWIWLLVHLVMLIQFGNKVLVLVQWAWSYWSRNRSARLITRYCYNRSGLCLLDEPQPPLVSVPARPMGALRACALSPVVAEQEQEQGTGREAQEPLTAAASGGEEPGGAGEAPPGGGGAPGAPG